MADQRDSEQSRLYELGNAFASRLEIDELIPLIVSKCQEAFAAEGASVVLVDADTNDLFFPYVTADDPAVASELARTRMPLSDGIAGAVARTGRPERVDDVASDPRFCGDVDRMTGVQTRTMICAPLIARGKTVGVIQVVNRRGGTSFSAEDLEFLNALAGGIGVAIENARLYEAARDSAHRLQQQVGALRRDLARLDRFTEILGTSPAMTEVFRLMESAASSTISVVIEGETGTGKELVARGIHRASPRADGPFICVNCAALPETLLESQLFGHRKGAFTGAIQDQRGMFESASSGTIFLDEIGEMPLTMQPKLLRVLQEGEVTPIGEHRPRPVDVHVLAATNRDLQAQVAAHAFREDLYYRLAAFPIRLPPLRKRREDIAPIVAHLLTRTSERLGKRIADLEPEVLARLTAFDWPGNVRELQNEIERAVTLARDGDIIGLEHLSPKLQEGTADAAAAGTADLGAPARADSPSDDGGGDDLRAARAAFEADFIREVLDRQGDNISRTARALGISRAMLQTKMKQYGLR